MEFVFQIAQNNLILFTFLFSRFSNGYIWPGALQSFTLAEVASLDPDVARREGWRLGRLIEKTVAALLNENPVSSHSLEF